MFELFSVSDAYQKALQIEKQASRRPSSTPWSATARPTIGHTSAKPIASLPPTNPPAITAGAGAGFGSGSKCFKCGEPGHRAFECRKGERPGKALFVDSDGVVNEQCESYEQEAEYDEEVMEEVVGHNGPLLVVRRLCYAPREAKGDSWLLDCVATFQEGCTQTTNWGGYHPPDESAV
ncbi:hypothetical protein Vadar_014571 [Vaccinium darrowii]|uniref:Uncharacterized protein n=1 Tax=Vaccinium darrowii TaxID=229202 RepID=A0ACB7Z3P9_9ERIC|nr:hypothetical protein Vadar_014571 [Vaccinium darrowii]